jgi:hypothetical protein
MSVFSEMTALADAIRSKSGVTGKLGIAAMTEAVNGISIGSAVQRKSGTFTTDNSGKATVNCGFQPDLVTVYLITYQNIEENLSIPFETQKYPNMSYCALGYHSGGIYEVTASKTSSGFSVEVYDLGYGSVHNLAKNKNFSYTAVKYT